MTKLAPPPYTRFMNEAFTWIEFPRLMLNAPDLLRGPSGDERVIVIPGFGAGDSSTFALRQYLSWLRHNVSGWQRGNNQGDVLKAIQDIAEWVRQESDQAGERIALIGWSMGGYLAREVSRELPDNVSQVITLGSPVIGGPKYTQIAPIFELRGESLDDIEIIVEQRERVPLTVPTTAIYSKHDGVVAWEACLDHKSPNVEHIEVNSTHMGLGFSPDVYRIVAAKLAGRKPGLA